MTHFYKKKIIHIVLCVLMVYSSLGNSVWVIAETMTDFFAEEIQVEEVDDSHKESEDDKLENEVITEGEESVEESEIEETITEEVSESEEILHREPRNLYLLTHLDRHWITRFLQGNAEGNRTQFPTTFNNYFLRDSRASIEWSGGNQLGNRTGNFIQGRLYLPRQFLYREGTSWLYAGVDHQGIPVQNHYQFGVNTLEHGWGDFRFSIQGVGTYQPKGPVLSPTNVNEGDLADFQEFTVRVERVRDASFTTQRPNSFAIDVEWVFNTYFQIPLIGGHAYHRNYFASVRQAVQSSFTELPAHTLGFARNPTQGASANPTAPATILAQGATTTVTAAAPATGYQFVGFDVSGTGSSVTNVNTSNRTGTFTMGSQNATVTARYELSNRTLTLGRSPEAGSNSNPTAPTTSLSMGATTTVTAGAPAPGYRFVGFDVSGAGSTVTNINTTNRTATFTMGTENATVTARYELADQTITLNRNPQAGSNNDPTSGSNTLQMGQETGVTAAPALPGYRFSGFRVTGAGSSLSNVNLTSRTATLRMGSENVTVTAEYASTIIRNADDLEKFLRSEFPYDSNDETYTFEPEANQAIDMAGKGNFAGRTQFSGNLIGHGTTIRNLSLVGSHAALGLIQTINGGNQTRIENLRFEGLTVNNTRTQFYSGGVVGQVASGTSIELEKIIIDETSQISSSQAYGSGGIVGQNNGTTTISASEVRGTLHTNTSNGLLGGIVGQNQGQLTIDNSRSQVTFTGGNNFTLNIGGLVGEVNGHTSIIDSRSESSTAINSSNGTYRGGLIGRVGNSGNITIQRSVHSGDMRGNNSYVGGFIGRTSGSVRIEESYHNGHVQGSTSLGTASFIGQTEGNGTLAIVDSYSVGSSNGNGVIGVNQMTNHVTLSQLYVAGFTGGQPITSSTTGITATNVYYDSSTTNKASTTGVGEAKTTLELIESTTSGLGFGNRWQTDFSESQRTNKTYPYLSWQTNNTQPAMFFNSINPMVDHPVSGNQVSVTFDLRDQPLRIFNPYNSGLAGEASSGTMSINRGNATRFSIGVINEQDVIGFTARRMNLSVSRQPAAGSSADPVIEKTNFLEGESIVVTAPEANYGYRFDGFSVNGANSTVTDVDLINRTATFTMGTADTTITANYQQTVIWTAEDLRRFLNSQAPFNRDDETYSIEPVDGQTIDMSGEGEFTGRTNFTGVLKGNNATIKNLTLRSGEASLGFIRGVTAGTVRIENLNFEGLTMDSTRSQSSTSYQGIISQVGGGRIAELENISIDGTSQISANQPNGSGGLVGQNNGTTVITNSQVLGTLHTKTSNGLLGGLVGTSSGHLTIQDSLSKVTFTGGNNFTLNIGGFVGETNGSVTIIDSISETVSTINSTNGTFRSGFIGRGNSADITIQRSINSSDMRGNNSYVGGFIGRLSGRARIEESYHDGHVQGSTGLGAGSFIGSSEGNGDLAIVDSYSIGSSNGNGVIGVNQMTNNVILSQLYVAGFTGGQPITSDTSNITATNVYYDSSTTNKLSTTGVGEAKTTLELIESTTNGLGFGNRWRTDFSVTQRTNKTYPYLSWQTNNTQPALFLNSIDPMVDHPVSGNQVTVTLDLQASSLKLFNPYTAGLATNASSGERTISRNGAARFSIGVINPQGVVGFTARRMNLTLTRDPITASAIDPIADQTNFIEGETTTIQAGEPSRGYRFVGFSVTGTGSSVTNINQTNRTATFTMGIDNATVTANYVQTVIRNATDLSRFLNSQAPFDKVDENYSIEPEDGLGIDMANAGTFSGREVYRGKLIGNHAVIRNLTLRSGEMELAFIRSAGGTSVRIENLTFENLNVTNTRGQSYTNFTAGLIAQTATTSIVELENVTIDGRSTITSNQSNGSGSFVGNNLGRLTIANSRSSSTIHTNTSNGLLGGLVGRTAGTLTLAQTSSAVRFGGGNNFSLNLGGMIAEAGGTVTITDSQSEVRSTIASSTSSYRGGLIGLATANAQVLIERSINSSDIRSANSYAGGFIGRVLGSVTINESYHEGYMLGNVSNGSGGFVGKLERNARFSLNDSYSIGSTNGNGVIGVVDPTATTELNQLFVAGFTGAEPITGTTTGITANNVYYDTTTTRKTTTTGVGEARRTTGLIDATIPELGFGEKWLSGFALGSSANRTYPYLKWQTNEVQTSEFFQSIQPEVDRAVTTNQVAVTLELAGRSLRLFNPYQADLPSNVTTGMIQINRNNATRFSIGVINEQGIVGFTGIGNYTDIQPISQVLNYGYEEKDYQAKDFVAVYKEYSQTDDYEARFVSFPDSLDGSSARVEVSKNGTVLATINVPVSFRFGHSLNIRGRRSDATNEDIRVATFSLNSNQTEIIATYEHSLRDGAIHSIFGNQMYYEFKHYDEHSVSSGPLNQLPADTNFSANGDDIVGILNDFGTNRRISVAKGEIVEIFHAEANGRLDNFQNDIVQPGISEQRSRYQITANGFERLNIDRLSPNEQKIVLGMSQEDLDKQISRYLDISQYPTVRIEGFGQYPDTSNEGKTSGSIIVSEQLVNGRTVTWEYPITFIVESDPAIHVTLPVRMAFNLKEEAVTSSDYQVINHSETTNLTVGFHTKNDVELTSTSDVVFLEESTHGEKGQEAMILYLQRIGEEPSDKPLVGQSSTFTGAQWTEIVQTDSQMELGFTGTYFGDTTSSNKVSGKLSLHFSATTN